MSEKRANWSVEDFGGATYLDGIEAQYAVMSGEDIAAYAFEADRARLIAAAPEMLEAAQLALHEMCNTTAPRNSFTDAVEALADAIAKATGATHD